MTSERGGGPSSRHIIDRMVSAGPRFVHVCQIVRPAGLTAAVREYADASASNKEPAICPLRSQDSVEGWPGIIHHESVSNHEFILASNAEL
ncbi:MAG: hypothetical protein Q7K26_00305 [bacterium]|nr:hypothetical protein [bacterium]